MKKILFIIGSLRKESFFLRFFASWGFFADFLWKIRIKLLNLRLTFNNAYCN